MKILKEFKNLIPKITDEEYSQLEESIIKEGCRDALVVWNDILLDGHNRLEICKKNNIEFETKEIQLDNENEAKAWIIKNQFGRRNLSKYDRSLLALELEELYKKEAKERQAMGGKGEVVPMLAQVKTRDKLAKEAGISHGTLDKVKIIKEQATDKQRAELKKGDTTINAIYNKVKRKKLTEKLETQELPKGKYNIIYADPAWKYWEGGNKNQSLHYSTSSIESIKDLPVADLADENCILFMWATWVILPEALKVIEAWGFKYSTVGFTWVKSKKDGTGFAFGCGSWTRANTEFCLIATKGSIPRKDASISQIIYEPKREHSRKPDIVRDKIIQLVGDLPRIELFARTKSKGWSIWGSKNESNKFTK